MALAAEMNEKRGIGGAFRRLLELLNSHASITAFRIYYLLLGLASFNSFCAFTDTLSLFAYVCAAWGGMLVCARAICFSRYVRFPNLVLLALFLAGYLLSAILSPYANILDTAQGFTWLTLEFFLLYLWGDSPVVEEIKKTIRLVAVVFVTYTLLASAAGLVTAVLGVSFSDATDPMQRRNIGMFGGRLWGVYSDPNYGAVFSVISVLFSLLLCEKKTKPAVAFLVLNILIQVSYLSLSGSKTGFVAAVVAIVCCTLALTIRSKGGRSASNVIKAALVSLAIVLAFVGSIWLVAKVYDAIPHVNSGIETVEITAASSDVAGTVDSAEGQSADGENSPSDDAPPDQAAPSDPAANATTDSSAGTLERVGKGFEQSASRIYMWMDAGRIFCANPLFGVSYRALGDYVADVMPGYYLGVKGFTSMHNVFADIAVGQGLFGLIPFCLFLVVAARLVLPKAARMKGSDYRTAVLCLCVLSAVLVTSMFYSEIVYINTAGSVLFWTILGCLVAWPDETPDEGMLRNNGETQSLDL